MANYHCSVKVISRASGRSAVACAAYRANERIQDERLGRTFDYSPRDAVTFGRVMLPADAPERLADRSTLWNEVEQAERRKDAQLAREVEVSLPHELTRRERVSLVTDYVQRNFVDEGMCADVCVHERADGHNPHAHIMLTMRTVDAEGFQQKNRDWNDKARLQEWRQDWERSQNRALELAYERQRTPEQERSYVDARSYAERGVERLPQVHEGPQVREMERQAQRQAQEQGREYRPVTEVRRQNIEIEQKNRFIERIDRAVEVLRERASQLREQIHERAQDGIERIQGMIDRMREGQERPRAASLDEVVERYQPQQHRERPAFDHHQEQEREPAQPRSLADIVAEAREASAALETDRSDWWNEREDGYEYEQDRSIGMEW